MKKWKTVAYNPYLPGLKPDVPTRILPHSGGFLEIQQLEDVEEWIDVSMECYTELIKSQSSSGWYITLKHSYKGQDVRVAVLGLSPNNRVRMESPNGNYKIEKVPDGRISFKVLMKV